MISLLRVSASKSENAAAAKSKIATSKLAATIVASGGSGTGHGNVANPLLAAGDLLRLEDKNFANGKSPA